MTLQVCVHTNDKCYHEHQVERENLSTRSFSDAITHATKPNTNALNNKIWDDKEIIYWRRDSSYPWIDDKTMDKLIKLAFLESSVETPLVIRQKKRDTADAQIIINWLGMKDEPYFKSASTLAYGYGPGPGLGGNITMNADDLWLLRKTPLTAVEAFNLGYIADYDRSYPNNQIKFYDPLHTLKHEGGHAIGMRHIDTLIEKLTAIMYPYYNGLRKFGAADLGYLTSLYGKASVNHRIKEELVNRIQIF